MPPKDSDPKPAAAPVPVAPKLSRIAVAEHMQGYLHSIGERIGLEDRDTAEKALALGVVLMQDPGRYFIIDVGQMNNREAFNFAMRHGDTLCAPEDVPL